MVVLLTQNVFFIAALFVHHNSSIALFSANSTENSEFIEADAVRSS